MDDDNPLEGHELDDAMAVDALMGWDGPTCATCGRQLGSDPEDEVDGDAELPICGECNRARNFDELESTALTDR